MAEIRLNKLMKQYNIGLGTLVDFLGSIGVDLEYNPNAKVSDSFLPAIQERFGSNVQYLYQANSIAKNLSNIPVGYPPTDPAIGLLPKASNTVTLSALAHRYQVSLKLIETTLRNKGVLRTSATPLTTVSAEIIPELDKELEMKYDSHSLSNTNSENGTKKVLNASIAPEEFDWDAFENECVAEELYDQTLAKIVENEVVEGVVTAINRREVVVNIGARSEGVISAPEFRYNPDLKVGDKVEVLVESADDRKGGLILSHKKARALKSWDMVNAAYDAGEIVKAFVKCRTKGGLIVDVFGIESFLPGSLIDIKPIRDYDAFVNTTMDVKIIKINQEFRNVVVSRKAVLEELNGTSPKENDLEVNLAMKEAVLEDLQRIVETQADPKDAFSMFRDIQNRWREIGLVPQQNFQDLNNRYKSLVERFYDMVQINHDLRDLDFKVNLEKKETLCEKAEKLSTCDDIVEVYQEVQTLHQ